MTTYVFSWLLCSVKLCLSTSAHHSTVRQDVVKMCSGGVALYPLENVLPCCEKVRFFSSLI